MAVAGRGYACVMELPFYIRAAATLVGLVAGVVAIVRSLSGASALHALTEGFALAIIIFFGCLAVVLLAAGLASLVLKGKDKHAARTLGSWGIMAAIALWGLLSDQPISEQNGIFGVVMFTGLGCAALAESRKRYKASRAVCPECAEVIRAQARVCKHCGYRFAPRLDAPVSP